MVSDTISLIIIRCRGKNVLLPSHSQRMCSLHSHLHADIFSAAHVDPGASFLLALIKGLHTWKKPLLRYIKSLYILEIKTHLKYPIKSVIFRVPLLLFTLSGSSRSVVHIGKTHLCDSCHVKREEIFTLRRFYYVHPFAQTSKGENICTPLYCCATTWPVLPLSWSLVSSPTRCNRRWRINVGYSVLWRSQGSPPAEMTHC